MAIVVPSRFSLLKMVEDDYSPPKPKENKIKKTDSTKAKKTDEKKPDEKKTNKNVKNNKQNNRSGRKKGQTLSLADSNDDKNKDNDLDDKYEDDLRLALSLSKMESEEKVPDCEPDDNATSANNEPFQTRASTKKQKKKLNSNVSETDCFSNNINNDRHHDIEYDDVDENHKNEPLLNLKLKKDTKNEVNRSNYRKKRDPPSNEEIKGSQLQSILEIKEQEIAELKSEVVSLKNELLTVKNRNKKLCSIIGQGEMKDKAEVIAEVEKLRDMNTELTNTIASLHAELEQARSTKVDSKFKDKKKKSSNEKEI